MKRQLMVLVILVAAVAAIGRAADNNAQKATQSKAVEKNEGERLFEVNCGRCHRVPEQISPKIAGSVVRHMRVRAMLSAEDEKQILKYLAP
jgi:mono/diheme cytochrome c family protein